MMQSEFEAIAGYEVTMEDYNNIIEPMYMASNLSKKDFVATISKKRFQLKPLSKMVKEMKTEAKQIRETCNHYTDYEAESRLESIVKEYIGRKYQFQKIGHFINEAYTYGGNRGCTYPRNIEIYSLATYKTIETIELF